MLQSFYPDDQRSGQFRDLPIIGLWGNKKMLSVPHKPIEATVMRQDGYRDAQMVPNDLVRRAASEDVHIDLYTWVMSDLDLTLI